MKALKYISVTFMQSLHIITILTILYVFFINEDLLVKFAAVIALIVSIRMSFDYEYKHKKL